MLEALTNTTFFRRFTGTDQRATYWGRLGERLVESDKKVIVFDVSGVLFSSDSIKEATEFYLQKRAEGRIAAGGVYTHYNDAWQPVLICNQAV